MRLQTTRFSSNGRVLFSIIAGEDDRRAKIVTPQRQTALRFSNRARAINSAWRALREGTRRVVGRVPDRRAASSYPCSRTSLLNQCQRYIFLLLSRGIATRSVVDRCLQREMRHPPAEPDRPLLSWALRRELDTLFWGYDLVLSWLGKGAEME